MCGWVFHWLGEAWEVGLTRLGVDADIEIPPFAFATYFLRLGQVWGYSWVFGKKRY